MKKALIATSILAFALHGPVFADGVKHGKEIEGKETNTARADKSYVTGVIRRVSKGSKKLTVKHGAIQSLDMPPMTMAFSLSDAKMIERVKKGDKIKFRAASIDGKMVITELSVQ